jgi:hypothetical protein
LLFQQFATLVGILSAGRLAALHAQDCCQLNHKRCFCRCNNIPIKRVATDSAASTAAAAAAGLRCSAACCAATDASAPSSTASRSTGAFCGRETKHGSKSDEKEIKYWSSDHESGMANCNVQRTCLQSGAGCAAVESAVELLASSAMACSTAGSANKKLLKASFTLPDYVA